jgi:hypothetical protein
MKATSVSVRLRISLCALKIPNIKPQVQWFLNKEDPPTDPSRMARGLGGYTHRVRSCAPSGEETRPSLTTPRPPLRARGLTRASGSRSTTTPVPGPWLLPGQRRQPRPRHKKTRPKLPRLGGSLALPLVHGIADHFLDKVTHEV